MQPTWTAVDDAWGSTVPSNSKLFWTRSKIIGLILTFLVNNHTFHSTSESSPSGTSLNPVTTCCVTRCLRFSSPPHSLFLLILPIVLNGSCHKFDVLRRTVNAGRSDAPDSYWWALATCLFPGCGSIDCLLYIHRYRASQYEFVTPPTTKCDRFSDYLWR